MQAARLQGTYCVGVIIILVGWIKSHRHQEIAHLQRAACRPILHFVGDKRIGRGWRRAPGRVSSVREPAHRNGLVVGGSYLLAQVPGQVLRVGVGEKAVGDEQLVHRVQPVVGGLILESHLVVDQRMIELLDVKDIVVALGRRRMPIGRGHRGVGNVAPQLLHVHLDIVPVPGHRGPGRGDHRAVGPVGHRHLGQILHRNRIDEVPQQGSNRKLFRRGPGLPIQLQVHHVAAIGPQLGVGRLDLIPLRPQRVEGGKPLDPTIARRGVQKAIVGPVVGRVGHLVAIGIGHHVVAELVQDRAAGVQVRVIAEPGADLDVGIDTRNPGIGPRPPGNIPHPGRRRIGLDLERGQVKGHSQPALRHQPRLPGIVVDEGQVLHPVGRHRHRTRNAARGAQVDLHPQRVGRLFIQRKARRRDPEGRVGLVVGHTKRRGHPPGQDQRRAQDQAIGDGRLQHETAIWRFRRVKVKQDVAALHVDGRVDNRFHLLADGVLDPHRALNGDGAFLG